MFTLTTEQTKVIKDGLNKFDVLINSENAVIFVKESEESECYIVGVKNKDDGKVIVQVEV